jgi:hypothetical protein
VIKRGRFVFGVSIGDVNKTQTKDPKQKGI